MTDKAGYVRIILSQQVCERHPATVGVALYTQNTVFKQDGFSIAIPAKADPSML